MKWINQLRKIYRFKGGVIMKPRMAGTFTTLETMHDSHETVDKQKRYAQIFECFSEHPEMTAKECAVEMQRKGYIPTSERNFVSPRLTELGRKGIVEPIGKKRCEYTGKTVSVWSMCEGRS